MNPLFVIYKDGKRAEREQSGRTIKIAYEKKGMAAGVITNLIHDHLKVKLDFYRYDHPERWAEEVEKERVRYEIVEYGPKEEME